MIRIAFTALTTCVCHLVVAQCAISTVVSLSLSCPNNATTTVNTTGGTAPFTIVVDRRGVNQTFWSSVVGHSWTNDADGDVTLASSIIAHWGETDSARATVTDALGCVAVHKIVVARYQATNPNLQTTPDCLTGMANAYVNFLCVPTSYSLDGSAYTALTSGWTFLGGGAYQYNGQLSGGTHVIDFTAVPCNFGYPVTACYTTGIASVQTVTPGDCGGNIRVKASLQGALPSGSVMTDNLRSAGLLPTTEPYTALGYTYTSFTGATTISPTLLTTTGNNAIEDWVVLELRSSSNSSVVQYSRPALLQRDGDVVDLDGDNYVNFPSGAGSRYVAIRHRNHLGIMTNTTRTLGVTPITVDFQTASTICHGTNARAQVGAIQCLWSGDANGNGIVSYTGANNDRDAILTAIGGIVPSNTLDNVYDRRDLNLDGTVKYVNVGNDRDIILVNIGGVVPTNTLTQQLP